MLYKSKTQAEPSKFHRFTTREKVLGIMSKFCEYLSCEYHQSYFMFDETPRFLKENFMS